jgi:cytochrome c553
MKYFILIIATTFIFSFIRCAIPQKVQYELPAEMAPAIKADYASQCEKGQILYTLNCAGCHNKKIKGKTMIPDFTSEQLVGYALRVTNARHEASITEESVSTEELGLIMTFLNYKKKNPFPVPVKPAS